MGAVRANSVIDRHARRLGDRARLVTLDLDPTDDPMRGDQQMPFFKAAMTAHFLPVMDLVSYNDGGEQHLRVTVLQAANATASVDAVVILCRLLRMVRYFFAGPRIQVRIDGGFAHPEELDFMGTVRCQELRQNSKLRDSSASGSPTLGIRA